MWDQIEFFDTFGISWRDRTQNKMADLLENVPIKPQEVSFVEISQIEIQNRPLVPDNIENW